MRPPDSALALVVATLGEAKKDPYMWFMDTGASHYTCKRDEGMIKQRKRISTEE